jgi:hypothetical protein
MTSAAYWQPVRDELDNWRKAGLDAALWLRDDDATEPTPQLERLIALTGEFDIALALAVVPARTGPALSQRLERVLHVHPLVHGWAHANHAPPDEKKQELGDHRPRATVLGDVDRGLRRLADLYGERLVPILVPPWNRIAVPFLDDLPDLGFKGLSSFGHRLASRPGLKIVNTHVDIVDSHAGNVCRDHGLLAASLARELELARVHGGWPVGILSHHLVSDDDAFRFLRDLFAITARSSNVRWRSPRDLLAAP